MVARNDPADFTNGPLGASDLNELARGEINCVKLTSNSSGTTSTEVILSDTIILSDNRRLMFFATTTLRSDIAGGIQARLDLDSTQIQRKNSDAVNAGTDEFVTFFTSQNVAAGSHTIEFITGVSGVAGNTVTAIANGATGTHGIGVLSVWDAGPELS